jgi:hypothetical protein
VENIGEWDEEEEGKEFGAKVAQHNDGEEVFGLVWGRRRRRENCPWEEERIGTKFLIENGGGMKMTT